MARLLSWPNGLRPNRMRPLAGPRTVGASQSEAISGFIQTTASAFGGLSIEFGFPDIRGQLVRRTRGWITAMHGGANATRVPICDWDGLSLAQMGVNATSSEWKVGQPWSNGMPWSNGENWGSSPPVVSVATAAARDATAISLASAFWGHTLGMGDWLGFFPNHFGRYEVTEVIAPGEYRIWPPLRAAITPDDFATLRPVVSMRLVSENGAQAERGPAFMQGLIVQLVEVPDYTVRDYFTD